MFITLEQIFCRALCIEIPLNTLFKRLVVDLLASPFFVLESFKMNRSECLTAGKVRRVLSTVLVLLSTKFFPGLFDVFCFRFYIIWFLVDNKTAELVHVVPSSSKKSCATSLKKYILYIYFWGIFKFLFVKKTMSKNFSVISSPYCCFLTDNLIKMMHSQYG